VRALHVYTCVACSVGSAHWVHFATARQLAHHRERCSWQDACSVVGVVVMIGSQLHNGMQQWGGMARPASAGHKCTARTGMGVEPTCAREYNHPSSVGVAPTCRVQRRRKENSHELDRLLIPAKSKGVWCVPQRVPWERHRDKIQIRDLGHDFVVDFGAHFHTTTITTMLDKQTAKE